MKENIDLNIDLKGNELVVRHGDAQKIPEPQPYKLVGELNNVKRYINMWGVSQIPGFNKTMVLPDDTEIKDLDTAMIVPTFVDPTAAIIEVDQHSRCITLKTDPASVYGNTIIGRLYMSPELEQFHINEHYYYSKNELLKLLRFNRRFFKDAEVAQQLYDNVQASKFSTQAELDSNEDTRGNRTHNFDRKVTTQLNKEFNLILPLFKGESTHDIRVELCFDVNEQDVRFWLESVELVEALEKQTEDLFKKALPTEVTDNYNCLYI